jgi:hypothetical protein
MRISPHVTALIDRCAPLWAAEAEIVRRYWTSPVRTPESDRLWLLRQMYKEYWDGFFPSYRWVADNVARIEAGCSSEEMLEEIEVMQEEFAHYLGFARVYAAVGDGAPLPDVESLRRAGNWPENVTLMALRAGHVRDHGDLGRRAHRFTEGGYCTLYAEGMALRGRGGIDERIAEACGQVHDDEFDHMLRGIAAIARDGEGLPEADWALLTEMAVEQMRARLAMRNAQFSFPVAAAELAAFAAGACAPLAFDYERAFGAA